MKNRPPLPPSNEVYAFVMAKSGQSNGKTPKIPDTAVTVSRDFVKGVIDIINGKTKAPKGHRIIGHYDADTGHAWTEFEPLSPIDELIGRVDDDQV